MAGYDEDFWGEDFFEEEEGGEETTETEVETEETAEDSRLRTAAQRMRVSGTETDLDPKGVELQAVPRVIQYLQQRKGRNSAPTFWHALRRRRRKGLTHALRENLRGF